MLTTAETARRLNVSQRRVHQLIAEGKLTAERHGRDWYVDAESVTAERRRRRKLDEDGRIRR